MSAILIDGKAIGEKVREEAKKKAAILKEHSVTPCLAVVLIGEDPASISYVTGKEKALEEAGMLGKDIRLPVTTTEAELLDLIAKLNQDKTVHGILVQLPLPQHIDKDRVIMAIDPMKDVDGFHPVSLGNMFLGRPGFLPCTPHGILVLLREMNIPTTGAHAVVVGCSNTVGKPLVNLLVAEGVNATVTSCHIYTKELAKHTIQADILVVAVGKAELVKPDMIKPGAVVIDVGVNRVSDPSKKSGFRLAGDVAAGAEEVASYLTPVPGGVGPMTIAMLMKNVADAAQWINSIKI
jgi:methylenetetrahydrofolate dehydrogenase (NADP+)/methenyltetrahydrofolate cyclohydrolase